jgi:hypothetical protein
MMSSEVQTFHCASAGFFQQLACSIALVRDVAFFLICGRFFSANRKLPRSQEAAQGRWQMTIVDMRRDQHLLHLPIDECIKAAPQTRARREAPAPAAQKGAGYRAPTFFLLGC